MTDTEKSRRLWVDPTLDPNRGTVSSVLRYLVRRSEKSISTISEESGVSSQTLYTILNRNASRADVTLLKKLADYFGEDISIFCGLDQYVPPRHLTEKEEHLLNTYNSLTDAARERLEDYIEDIAGNPKNLRRGP